ncbi:MAG: O-antigen ligase domain-containing protein [Acidobacteria bacterium]|nr:MAG: O-antigen ligase domain-containing protein [Acidobacteriota bacterium]
MRFGSVFPENQLAHATLMGTITVGFFLAYIKDHYPSPLSYFLFDIGLVMTLFFWLTGTDRVRRLTLPGTPLTQPLLLFYAVCFVYMFFPQVPMLVSLSAFRGWCVSSLAFLFGYDLITSSRQVRVYLWLVVGLAMIAGLYGVYQYAVGIEHIIGQSPIMAERHRFATYVTEEGEVEFRIFSTFVSASAFGTMMAYASFIAMTLALSERVKRRERWLLMLAIVPMVTSLVLTGTRAALIMMLIGVIVLCWYKRRFRNYMTVLTLIFLGIQLGIGLTQGRAAERFATLMHVNIIIGRLMNPLTTGWQAIVQAPLGHGLGVTGHGVPFFLLQRYPELHLIFSDGDFGRAMVEMGVVGLLLLAFILFTAIRGAHRSLQILRTSSSEDIALAVFGSAVMVGVTTLVGSPFLGIPHGVLWWFFLGALFKLRAVWIARGVRLSFHRPYRRAVVRPVRHPVDVSPT